MNYMKKTILFLFFVSFSVSQTKDSVYAKKINAFNTNYKEFEVVGNIIYALTNGDSLISINLVNDKSLFKKNNIKSITKSKNNKIYVLTDKGELLLKKNNKKYIVIDTFEGIPYKILMDKKDDFIIFSSKYVRYKNKNYIPQKDSPLFRKAGRVRSSSTLIPADVYYVDNKNIVWFGYDAGEWGGDICFFDLNSKLFYDDKSLSSFFNDKYDRWPKNDYELLKEYPNEVKIIEGDTIIRFPLDLYISNIKGITQNKNDDFYIATSLMHFSIESNLSKLNKTKEIEFYLKHNISNVLGHKVYEEKTENYYDNDGNIKTMNVPRWEESLEYLGSVTFNPFNKHVYYYTNNGFWKLIENKSNISKEFIFKPWISWKAGMPDAVGYQMNVSKFEFINENKIVFLTSNNGIGYFDGEKVKYFK